MNSIERMYPAMSAEELSNIILKGKGRCHYCFYSKIEHFQPIE